MIPDQKFNLSELRQVGKVFDDMINEVGHADSRKTLRTAVRKTLRPEVAAIKASTPVESGKLRDSTSLSVRKGRYWSVVGWVGWWTCLLYTSPSPRD